MNAGFCQLYHRTKKKKKKKKEEKNKMTHTQSPPPQQSGWCHWMREGLKKRSCNDSHCLVTQRHPLEHCFPGWPCFSLCDMQCGTLSLQPTPSAAACPMVSVPAGRHTQWHNLPHGFCACRQSHTQWHNLPHGLKRQQGYIRSEAIRQPVRFKHLRGTECPIAPHLTRLSSDRGHNKVQNLALK